MIDFKYNQKIIKNDELHEHKTGKLYRNVGNSSLPHSFKRLNQQHSQHFVVDEQAENWRYDYYRGISYLLLNSSLNSNKSIIIL